MGGKKIMRKLLCMGNSNFTESEILREEPVPEDEHHEKNVSRLEGSHVNEEDCWCGLSYENLMEDLGEQETDSEVARNSLSSTGSERFITRLKKQFMSSTQDLARVSESSVNSLPPQRQLGEHESHVSTLKRPPSPSWEDKTLQSVKILIKSQQEDNSLTQNTSHASSELKVTTYDTKAHDSQCPFGNPNESLLDLQILPDDNKLHGDDFVIFPLTNEILKKLGKRKCKCKSNFEQFEGLTEDDRRSGDHHHQKPLHLGSVIRCNTCLGLFIAVGDCDKWTPQTQETAQNINIPSIPEQEQRIGDGVGRTLQAGESPHDSPPPKKGEGGGRDLRYSCPSCGDSIFSENPEGVTTHQLFSVVKKDKARSGGEDDPLYVPLKNML